MGGWLTKNGYSALEFEDIQCEMRWRSQNVQLISYRRIPSDTEALDADSLGLPDDVWLQIFSYLPLEDRVRVSYVCRKWNILCRDSTFWRTVNFQLCNIARDTIIDSTVRAVTSYSPTIQVIDLSGGRCEPISDIALSHVARYCPNLRQLNLAGRRKVSNRGIRAIARTCSSIERLNLEGCEKISTKGIKVLASKCNMLEHLSLAHCSRVTDTAIALLAKKCKNLKVLDIAGCINVTDRGMEMLARYCERLKDINLKDTIDISIEGIELLVRGSPQLTRIQLGIVQDSIRTVAALNIIVKYCHNLQFVSFQHYHNPNTQGGVRKFVSKRRLGAFVNSLNACAFVL